MKFLFFRKYKALVFAPSVYAMFQYLLLQPYNLKDTLFFYTSDSPIALVPRFLNSYPCFCLYHSRFKRLIINEILFSIVYYFSKRCETVYLDALDFHSRLFIRNCQHVMFLEDGVGNYGRKTPKNNEQQISLRKKVLRKILGSRYFSCDKTDGKVEKIFLTGILPIPFEISGKVEILNLKELWSQRSPEERDEICRIFLPEGLVSVSVLDKEVLLLTQPYSEDSNGRFSEAEKIEVYRLLIAGLDESTILIKVHPRETTNYKIYFPCATIFSTPCPMELLTMLDIKFKKAITVNSTAIYNLDSSTEKIITGMSVTPQLHKEMKILERSVENIFW